MLRPDRRAELQVQWLALWLLVLGMAMLYLGYPR